LTAATAVVSVLFAFVLAANLMVGTASQRTLSLTSAEEAAPQVVPEAEASPATAERAEVGKALPDKELPSSPPARGEVVGEEAVEEEGLAGTVNGTPGAGSSETREAPPVAAVEEAPHEDAPAQAPTFEIAGGGTDAALTPAPAPLPPSAEGERDASPEGTPSAFLDAPGRDETELPAEEQVEPAGGQGIDEGLTAARAELLPWHVLEIALGITAVILAIATVLAWRARRH
jgi:hypothetical protein